MLSKLTDEILAEHSDEDIAAYIVDHYGGPSEAPPAAAISHYIAVLRIEPELREWIFKLFSSAPLLCSECGKPSCLHGYPDD